MSKKKQQKLKVLVAMSGGVDSSVVVALLVKAGYDVTGAYMKQWDDADKTGVCTWKQDRRDALRVAAHLGIPLLTLDFEKEYQEWVMSYMFAEYEKGLTPNPDVLCNKFIKFGAWLKKAQELGFDKLATGHYACLGQEKTKNKSQETNKIKYKLLEVKDTEKDQTYFLHQLSQEQLSHTLFPIGDYTKKEVRKMAIKFGLPTAERAESMGICFIGEVSMKEFLLKKIKLQPGAIVTSDGQKIGGHDGLPFYTIGQRHLGIKNYELRIKNDKIETKPLYIVDKNFAKNELVVGDENDLLLYKKEIEVGEVNWISGQVPVFPLKCEVRLRHRQTKQPAVIAQADNKTIIKFKAPQKAVTPGQFAVIYKNGECFGGGVIK